VLRAGRITETHSEDKETCTKHQSEITVKVANRKETCLVNGSYQKDRKGEILIDMNGNLNDS